VAVIHSQSFCGLIVAVSAATPRADACARKPTRPGRDKTWLGLFRHVPVAFLQ
jgi:hypothetical protein